MDKSMVHELNPLVTSNVQFNRSSFIHTTHEITEINDLRKSRIQNLPNYRRDDLSGKLNFVVVFQGIQIERLSAQIETARVKIKDYERQIGNYQNYEVQIRELTEKCHSYELQKEDHQYAMEKIQKVCQQLYNEIQEMRNRYADIDLSIKEKYRLEKERGKSLEHELEKWKARYSASESSKTKQLEDMRLLLENQRKSMLQRQIRQLSVKHESERSMLQNELRKMRETMNNKNLQIDRIKNQLSQSLVRQHQLSSYEARMDEYQDKLMLMAQQNMRLNQMLRNKKEEIENFKRKQRQLESRLSNLREIQNEFKEVNQRIQEYEVEINQWNERYSRLEDENNRNVKAAGKAEQYGRLLDNSADEMEKMNTIIRQKISEIQRWKSQNQRLSIELDQSKAVESRVQQYQEHIDAITTENQRLNGVLKARLTEIESWKSKYIQIENKLTLLAETQNECRNLRDKLSAEIDIKTQLNQKIRYMETDLIKAAQLQKKYVKEQNNSQNLVRQIQRLNSSIRDLSNQNGDYSKKINLLENQLKQNSGIQQDLQQCKKKIRYMTQQLDRINGILHKKIQQINQLKENYNSVNINISRYRTIEEQLVANLQQTEQLVLKLDEARRQNDCIQEKVFTFESKYKQVQSELFASNQEKDKLVTALNHKKAEIEDYASKIGQMQTQIRSLQQTDQQYQSLKKSMSQMEHRYSDLQNRYRKQAERGAQYSNQVQKLTSEMMKLKSESNFSKQFIAQFKNVRCEVQVKDQQIATLLKRIATIQKLLLMVKQESKKNYNNMCIYHEKWEKLNKSFQIVSEFMDRYANLQSKVEQLSEHNLELESSVNIMNIEMTESSYASQNTYNKIKQSSNQINNHTATSISSYEPSYYLSNPSSALSNHNNNNHIQLSTINEESQKTSSYDYADDRNPFKKEQNGHNNNNYYESQVREISHHDNNYTNSFSPRYSNSGILHSAQHRASSFGSNSPSAIQHRVSYNNNNSQVLRPASHREGSSSYTYDTSNFGGSRFSSGGQASNISSRFGKQKQHPSSQYTNNHINSYNSNISSNNNYEQPSSYGQKDYKYSSRVQGGSYQNSTSNNNDGKKAQNDGESRRMVLSPVRFLN